MATSPQTSPKFVTADQVAKDIRSLFIDGPIEIANELRTHLRRESNCDFNAQIISSINSDTGDSLAQHVRTYVRSTTGDGTQLKASQRLYVNAVSKPEKESSIGIARTGSQLSYPMAFSYERSAVRHRSTLGPCFTRNGNVLTFTRKAKILLVAKLNWSCWSGADKWDAPTVDPSWRFSSGGNNRTVTASLNLLMNGEFENGASSTKRLPQTVVFFEEEVYPAQVRQLLSVTELDVLNHDSSMGFIETITLEVERSPYVISYGARTDHIGFFKTTAAGTEDSSNYIEITEL